MRMLCAVVAVVLAGGCPNAEEEAKKKADKQKAFMEAEANARAEEDRKARELAISESTQKCSTDAAACITLGDIYAKEPKDPVKALAAYDDACNKKDKKGCTFAAQIATAPQDQLARWQKGCELDDADACVQAVASLDAVAKGGAAVDQATQVKLLDKACTLGVGRTCTALGLLVVESDPKKAQEQFERGCNAKEPTACVQIADLYKKGKIGKKKEAERKADEYLKKACDLGLTDVCAR